jgi:hypothetical protein
MYWFVGMRLYGGFAAFSIYTGRHHCSQLAFGKWSTMALIQINV